MVLRGDMMLYWLARVVVFIRRLLNPRRPAPPPEIIPPAPAILEPVELDYGNIRPLLGEETDPDTFGPEIHDFPELGDPVTRFEDFNRRLFVTAIAGTDASWPETTADDFATRIHGMTETTLLAEITRRLRPRYPVIYDTYGYWAVASARLEQTPDYSDDFIEAYLSIPEQQRPVVISVTTFNDKGRFVFMRYGFADLELPYFRLRLYVQDCLKAIMEAMIGPREGWLWFSVARMRHAVVELTKLNQARRQESEAAAYLEGQTAKAKKTSVEAQNRFVALFKTRIPAPSDAAAASAALPAPAAGEPS